MSRAKGFVNTYADALMRERMVKEVGAYTDHFLNVELASPKSICVDFGIDFKTTKALRQGKITISHGTIRKFCYVFAYYLDRRQQELETQERNILRKKERLAELQRLIDAYKDIYGFYASFCLELIHHEHRDLREIMKEE